MHGTSKPPRCRVEELPDFETDQDLEPRSLNHPSGTVRIPEGLRYWCFKFRRVFAI